MSEGDEIRQQLMVVEIQINKERSKNKGIDPTGTEEYRRLCRKRKNLVSQLEKINPQEVVA